MTSGATTTADGEDWLPDEAFAAARVTAVLFGPVARWSARWFVQGAPVTVSPSAARDSLAHGATIEADMPDDGARTMLEAALGLEGMPEAATPDDRAVLNAFLREMVGDLISILNAALAPAGTEQVRLAAGVMLNGCTVLTLLVPRGSLAAAIKAQIGPAKPASSAPVARTEAVRISHIDVVAVLGSVELAFDELGGVGLGDVLILDRALKEPVELRLGARRVAQGRLSRNGDRAAIQL